ncbi:MAG: hypothetical protein ACI8P3_003625 [Saprospiraceae bacterium]|jgi:hypothetical protein
MDFSFSVFQKCAQPAYCKTEVKLKKKPLLLLFFMFIIYINALSFQEQVIIDETFGVDVPRAVHDEDIDADGDMYVLSASSADDKII